MLIILLAGFIVFIALPFSSAKYTNKVIINKSADGSVIVNVYDSQNDKWVSEKNFKIPLPNVSESYTEACVERQENSGKS